MMVYVLTRSFRSLRARPVLWQESVTFQGNIKEEDERWSGMEGADLSNRRFPGSTPHLRKNHIGFPALRVLGQEAVPRRTECPAFFRNWVRTPGQLLDSHLDQSSFNCRS